MVLELCVNWKLNLNLTLADNVEYGIFLKANRIQRALISSRSPLESVCSTITDLLEQGTLTLSFKSKSSMISAGQMTHICISMPILWFKSHTITTSCLKVTLGNLTNPKNIKKQQLFIPIKTGGFFWFLDFFERLFSLPYHWGAIIQNVLSWLS